MTMGPHFHYNCVRILSERAGFSPEESDVIAYASQYTDNATEHKPIRVDDMPEEALPQAILDTFNPVCTAHEALQYITKWRNKEAQRKVYMSFHFIPPRPYEPEHPFEFVVSPNSVLARSLVTEALEALAGCTASSTERLRNLIRFGIALHSFADTWAHQEFSGRFSPTDNDVQDREIWDRGSWRPLPALLSIGYNMAPDIGHAEMANLVDETHMALRFKKASTGKPIERNNTVEFLKAARTIYEMMLGVTCRANDWAALSLRLETCFRDSSKWQHQFACELNQPYDRMRWRREALGGLRHDWDEYNEAEEFAALHYDATGDLKWFLFHVEAGKQRDYVTRQLGGVWL
jgi:hypothetical protein